MSPISLQEQAWIAGVVSRYWGSPAVSGRVPPTAKLDAQQSVLIGCLILLGLALIGMAASRFGFLAPSDCRASPARLVFGTDVDATITVKGGVACSISVRSATASIDELTIRSFPEHGTVSARGRTGVIYRSHPGFSGEDSFTFALLGRSGTQGGTSVIRVGVVVEGRRFRVSLKDARPLETAKATGSVSGSLTVQLFR